MASNEEVAEAVRLGLQEVPERNRKWIVSHLLSPPEPVFLATEMGGALTGPLWIITKDIGEDDSAYRVVFDELRQCFGLEMTTETGESLYLGPFGRLAATIDAM